MTRLQRVTASLILAGAFAPPVFAQAPAAPARPSAPASQRPAPYIHALTPRRSVVHTNPYPYPGYYRDDAMGGYRNPGGVGRYAEYYPPGDQFQIDPSRVSHVATFDTNGGVPDRAEQLAAQQVGIQSNSALQSHIDSYARPYLGVGYFGGYR